MCTGNTCRSPVVEGLLKQQLELKGLTDWVVQSAGTDAEPGNEATNHSVAAAFEQCDIDISQHRSTRLGAEQASAADLIICMAEAHRTKIEKRFEISNCKLLAELAGEGSVDVVDPHGLPRENYNQMVSRVSTLIGTGLDKIIQQAAANAAKRA